MNRKSIIISLSGYNLTKKEKQLILKYKPWGIILFARNIVSIKQCRNLTNEIRKLMKDNKYPILVDEEGGTVSRIKNIYNSPNNRDDTKIVQSRALVEKVLKFILFIISKKFKVF